jgi:hypothetical protein
VNLTINVALTFAFSKLLRFSTVDHCLSAMGKHKYTETLGPKFTLLPYTHHVVTN